MNQINNNIEESYCSFEVSKLLKEKGFNVLPEKIIKTDYIWGYVLDEDNNNNYRVDEFQWEDATQSNKILRPTHALAVEWIRVNFGIWILAYKLINTYQYKFGSYISPKEYNSPQEAVEAALLYTLNNLI